MDNPRTSNCPACGSLMHLEQEDCEWYFKCSCCGTKVRKFPRLERPVEKPQLHA
jgi:hypothetical protein